MSRSLRLTALSAIAAVLGTSTALAAPDVLIQVDQTQLLNLDRPAATVVVGNTAIADVTIIDNDSVFVLGKSFGVTNLIALDADGHEIANLRVSVNGQLGRTVTVMRGNAQASYACAPACNPIPTQGDSQASFELVTGQISTKAKTAADAAALASNGQVN